jgi:hypothetical protein
MTIRPKMKLQFHLHEKNKTGINFNKRSITSSENNKTLLK